MQTGTHLPRCIDTEQRRDGSLSTTPGRGSGAESEAEDGAKAGVAEVGRR